MQNCHTSVIFVTSLALEIFTGYTSKAPKWIPSTIRRLPIPAEGKEHYQTDTRVHSEDVRYFVGRNCQFMPFHTKRLLTELFQQFCKKKSFLHIFQQRYSCNKYLIFQSIVLEGTLYLRFPSWALRQQYFY
jgi:hypothetical protein